MRWLVLLAFIVACKKKAEPEPDPAPSTTPAVGHSVTKIKDPDEADTGSDKASGKSSTPGPTTSASRFDAGGPEVEHKVGGNGKPAYRDDDGHLHGPGGPVFMGRGAECTDKVDHCMRDDVWFACGDVVAGRLYRAVPAFEFEKKWWTFRGDEAEWKSLFKTKVATPNSLRAGDPVVWLIEDNSAPKFLNSEHDALTSSRWECGVIDNVGSSTFKVKGWDYAIPMDTARAVVERKSG